MSNVVWSPREGWHDGPTVHVRAESGRIVAEPAYIYRDEHVHDIQPASAFRNTASGWTAEYEPTRDVWHVHTPSGLFREYRRAS